MIHDFATAPRQTDWRQPRSPERQKSVTAKDRKTNAQDRKTSAQPSPRNWKRTLVPLVSVGLLCFLVQAAISGGEPELDQQPDAAAKREYAEAVLLSEDENTPSAGPASPAENLSLRQETTAGVAGEAGKSSQGTRVTLSQDVKPVIAEPEVAETANNTAATAADSDSSRAEALVVADVTVDPDYGFYDSLKQGSWPVPISKGAYVDGELAERERPVYKLQAASFRSKDDAYRLASRLKKHNLRAVVVPSVSTSGQYWYQVSVGPFISTTKLNKAQDILVSMSMMPLKKRVQ
ncbi:MAG: SPOR domain-containing protein [Ketobacteraceae bacterium]|nr:SPOR domain-containing protein [Ketobacteraceae bacterium]